MGSAPGASIESIGRKEVLVAVAPIAREGSAAGLAPLDMAVAGSLDAVDVLARLGSTEEGLAEAEAARRLRAVGPNAVRSHRAHALPVLGRQLRSPLLILLTVTATTFGGPDLEMMSVQAEEVPG